MTRHLNRQVFVWMGREAFAACVPAAAALGLFLLASPGTAETYASSPVIEKTVPEATHERRLDRGNTRALNLGALDRRYRNLAKTFKRAFQNVRVNPPQALRGGHDAKIPACTRRREREIRLTKPLPLRFRGKTFYFTALPRSGWLRLPPDVAKDRKTQVLITRMDRPQDLAKLSRNLKRRLDLVSGEFVRALGVRCVKSRVTIARDGKGITLHESR